uniref:Uncharacterized protein n=1 Tax=Zea mays TaxID=4577 RepID=C0HFD5_MAIZE|nr:unknown [Zea mays]
MKKDTSSSVLLQTADTDTIITRRTSLPFLLLHSALQFFPLPFPFLPGVRVTLINSLPATCTTN